MLYMYMKSFLNKILRNPENRYVSIESDSLIIYSRTHLDIMIRWIFRFLLDPHVQFPSYRLLRWTWFRWDWGSHQRTGWSITIRRVFHVTRELSHGQHTEQSTWHINVFLNMKKWCKILEMFSYRLLNLVPRAMLSVIGLRVYVILPKRGSVK